MKKKIKIILISVSILFIGYYAFYFVAISGINYFSNPQCIEIENEKTELKKINII